MVLYVYYVTGYSHMYPINLGIEIVIRTNSANVTNIDWEYYAD